MDRFCRLTGPWLLALAASMGVTQGAAAQGKRPYVIEDIFKLEAPMEGYSLSPAGNEIAFVVKRAIETDMERHYIFANDRADVWLHDRKTGETRNLTQGLADHADFWAPAWSPRGDR